LCNALATFERVMKQVLREFISKICLVSFDNVIIFGKIFEEMIQNLKCIITFARSKLED